jgi:hypothetical protein
LKSDIEIAPVHHRLPDRIRAHALISQLRQLGASFPVFLSGGVRKVNVLAAFGKAFR